MAQDSEIKAPAAGPTKSGHEGMILDGLFEVGQKIGSGAQSLVYQGRDLQDNKPVAIKILKTNLVWDQEISKRFRQEALAVRRLKHPNIVSVVAYGFLPTSEPYLVMEYLDGRSLGDMLAQEGGWLPVNSALRIFALAAQAMNYAHTQGYLHRDLSPGNLVVILDEIGEESVKIVDFGMIKMLDHATQAALYHTNPGETVGTPLYMSPEQIRGDRIDGRSDVYSLGCVLYETLTGVAPFDSESVFEILQMHLEHSPLPPSSVSMQPGITSSIDEVVMKSIAREPSDRFMTMTGMAAALKSVEQELIESASMSGRISGFFRRLSSGG